MKVFNASDRLCNTPEPPEFFLPCDFMRFTNRMLHVRALINSVASIFLTDNRPTGTLSKARLSNNRTRFYCYGAKTPARFLYSILMGHPRRVTQKFFYSLFTIQLFLVQWTGMNRGTTAV